MCGDGRTDILNAPKNIPLAQLRLKNDSSRILNVIHPISIK